MHTAESLWLKKNIIEHKNKINNILNVGSSTKFFREVSQPHIHLNVIRTLNNLKIKVFNLDLKKDEDIDFCGDILSDSFFNKIKKNQFSSILCSNILEHVDDPIEFSKRLMMLVKPGGLIFITAPTIYPIHYDPIDNNFRPNIFELNKIFNKSKIINSKLLNVKSLYSTKSNYFFFKLFTRLFIPFYKYRGWLTSIHMLKWLFKDRYISCVVLEKLR